MSQAALDVNWDTYVAFTMLITLGTATFINPKKGTLSGWLYWVIVPLAAVVLMTAATHSVVGGLGFGSMPLALLAVIYIRFNYDKRP